jgi:uncharacterized RDD family membrane protein YckC
LPALTPDRGPAVIDRPFTPASLPLRVAAMIYDGILLFGVVFVTSYALLAALGWSYPLATGQRNVLQAALFVAIGAYFVSCWSRSGQTLALKTWKLRLIDASGRPPGVLRATARYLAAWHLWLPGLAVAALIEPGPGFQFAALLAGFGVLLIPGWLDAKRRLLHDRCSGTRIVRV